MPSCASLFELELLIPTTYTYAETGYASPHAATAIGGLSLTYDNNGNVTAYGSLDYTWDWRNRIASAERTGAGGFTNFGYDHAGSRMWKATGSATTSYPSVAVRMCQPLPGQPIANLDVETIRRARSSLKEMLAKAETVADETPKEREDLHGRLGPLDGLDDGIRF